MGFGVSVGKKKKKTRGDHFKLRFRKNFQALLEEQVEKSGGVLGVLRGIWGSSQGLGFLRGSGVGSTEGRLRGS